MSDETSVYIDALMTFGTQLYLKDARTVATGLAGSMTGISSAIVGVLGTHEAQSFGAWNAGMLEAFGYLVRDVGLGYPSLGGVAIIMGSHYLHGDLSQADAMNNATTDVMDAFNPSGGTKTIDDIDKSQAPAVNQPKQPSNDIPLDQCHQYSEPAKPNSPLAKWQEHQNRYQQWENWRPTDPDPSARPKPTPPPAQTSKPKPPSNATPSPSPESSVPPPHKSKPQPNPPSKPQIPIVCPAD